MEIRRREGEGGGRKGKVENRIIVQRRPRCRLGADEKEEMKWTVRLTGIYILSCAICVSELCRVTVRRIRSGKSVIITRATLAEASPLPSDFAIPSSPHPLLLSPPLLFHPRLPVSVSQPRASYLFTLFVVSRRNPSLLFHSLFLRLHIRLSALSPSPPTSPGRKLAARALASSVRSIHSSPSTGLSRGREECGKK